MHIAAWALIALLVLGPGRVMAQDDQTLADIRQELTVLFVQVQQLKRELSTTGGVSTNLPGASTLEKIDSIEAALKHLTSKTEQLENRINRIVTDGTNRIGDLEFRLVELEGGDVSTLGETTTLGGDAGTATGGTSALPSTDSGQSELAMGEGTDFKAAEQALSDKDYRKAADMFAQFNASYPGSPMAAKAELNRGHALDGLGDTREAARAYLAGFVSNETGPVAPEALFELGSALGRLGQTDQACVTLGEVAARFPVADAVAGAQNEMTTLGCN
ncbi:MAG: tol-pal system protein YbgF [Rhodobacteraceae bacterium]|nr:tol-pal system protein YbgF [Paracoccaceae bacterium]